VSACWRISRRVQRLSESVHVTKKSADTVGREQEPRGLMFASAYNSLRYDKKISEAVLTPESAGKKILDLVRPGSTVLEVGCSTGYYTEYLTTRKGCKITAVEADAVAAECARPHCERLVVGNIERDEILESVADRTYEVLFLVGVLEHLIYPDLLLVKLRRLVEPESGYLVISFPNIAHWTVRLNVLMGRFDYQDTGLLDRSHLRFFTRKTARELIEGTGYIIETVDMSIIPPGARFARNMPRVLKGLQRILPTWVGQELIFKVVRCE
jgi:2-polyprenyl-3-methyl-5-hydroxy-6-metoxy-1,4-benzoquinol methylase